MPPKRKLEDISGPQSSKDRKKQRVNYARTIAVQSVPKASTSTASAHSIDVTNSLKGLPNVIDVERFTEARAFEINAMRDAMVKASGGSNQRAWQALPRHLRRRAASHDVRRVPRRLRARAVLEMDPVKRKKMKARPALGKSKRLTTTERFLKRQKNKVWLETHLWHAKRMHMRDMWGYRLAVQPTEKSFRASHRASVHGAIFHDASYHGLIEIKGPQLALKGLLQLCCDPQGHGPAAKRYLTGARRMDTHIYEPFTYPFGLIAPISLIWRPLSRPKPETKKNGGSSKKVQEKDTGSVDSPTGSEDSLLRTVWLQCHPSVYDTVFSAVQECASTVLHELKQANQGSDATVEIVDLRERFNIFDIVGPKASQVIRGALSPMTQDVNDREEFKKFWSCLGDIQTAGAVPRGMVIGFTVHDPRLKFPPKNAVPRSRSDPDSPNFVPSPASQTFPSATLALSEIWEDKVRQKIQKPKFKKSELDARKAKQLVPGKPLPPQRKDDHIPILLVQCSVEPPSYSSYSSNKNSQALHGWTLIIPSGWGMPFMSSLTHTGTRVGGQREVATQHFEAGAACFPRDYPSTHTYETYASQREDEEKAKWERTPPAKRVNFEKLGTRSPWRPDWDVVLGLQQHPGDVTMADENEHDPDLVDAQRRPSSGSDPSLQRTDNETPLVAQPWIFRGADAANIIKKISTMLNAAAGLHAELMNLRAKRNMNPASVSISADELLRGALVHVRLEMSGRGAPDNLANIYEVNDVEATKWNRLQELRRRPGVEEEGIDETTLSDEAPSPNSIIGYVTAGNFSLSRGKGFSIGLIPLVKLLSLQQQATRLRLKPGMLVKIRDRDGQKCRAATVFLLDT